MKKEEKGLLRKAFSSWLINHEVEKELEKNADSLLTAY